MATLSTNQTTRAQLVAYIASIMRHWISALHHLGFTFEICCPKAMVEPSTGIAAIASAAGIIGNVIRGSFAYREVPRDVQAFQSSVESFSATLGKAKRLRRVTSHLLDSKDKEEIDKNIARSAEVLDNISGTIEACRKDLANRGTVSSRNRLLWLVRDHNVFLARTHGFGICHQSLNTNIIEMRQLQGVTQLPPPVYDASEFEGPLRPPSRRRPPSESKQLESDIYELGDSDRKSSGLIPIKIGVGEEVALMDDNDDEIAPVALTPWKSSSSLTLVSSSSSYGGRSAASEQDEVNKSQMAPWRTRRSSGLSRYSASECETSLVASYNTTSTLSSESVPWTGVDSDRSFRLSSFSDCDTLVVGDDYDVNAPSTASWRTMSDSDINHTFQPNRDAGVEGEDRPQRTTSITPRRQRRGFMIT